MKTISHDHAVRRGICPDNPRGSIYDMEMLLVMHAHHSIYLVSEAYVKTKWLSGTG